MSQVRRSHSFPPAIESLESRELMAATGYAIGIDLNDSASATVAKVTPVLKNLGVKTLRLWDSVTDFTDHTMTAALQRAVDYSNAGFDVTLEVNTANGAIPSTSAVKGWFAWAVNNSSLKSAVDRWEIGNEPDHATYWQGTLAQYVTGYLEPAYQVLHAAGETVVSAGPSYNPADVQTMINAGLLNYTDYVGFHPYAYGVAAVEKSVAAINAVVAGRKPIAATEWNVRGLESDKAAWSKAVEAAYPAIRDGFALNYYFATVVQDSPAGPAGILTTGLAVNQPFYDAFATFAQDNSGGNTPSGIGSITGTLFNDSDGDGVFDASESATGVRVVYIDANHDGKYESGEKTTTSNSKGVYVFNGLAAGTYDIGRVFSSGYKLSNNALGYVAVTVAAGQVVSGVNLGSTPSASAAVPTVTAFRLIDAATDTPVAAIGAITASTTLKLSRLPAGGINFEVDGNGLVGSIKITALGKTSTENTAPYSVFGDDDGDYAAWIAKRGSYTLTATAYGGDNATGAAGTTLQATITIV